MITRSFGNNFEVQDYTQELKLVPASWTILGDSGLFTPEYLSAHTVSFEEQNGSLGLVTDQVRGARPSASNDVVRKLHQYSMTHHPIVDRIQPQDLQGKSAYGQLDVADTLAAQLERKMVKLRKSYSVTQEVARFSTLTTGNVYAPNGTISGNFFSDFGISQTTVDFALNSGTTDVLAKCEAAFSAIQDNAKSDEVITGVTAYCSPAFFAKLIGHAKVVAAYQYYSSTQEPLRQRAGGTGLYREFVFGAIRFIEVRTVLAGATLIPAGDAVFVPNGVDDAFVTYFGPANRMDFVNTVAEDVYMWTFNDVKGLGVDVEAESNFINVLRKPALVVRGYTA